MVFSGILGSIGAQSKVDENNEPSTAVGWYILGENQEQVGPYVSSELHGKFRVCILETGVTIAWFLSLHIHRKFNCMLFEFQFFHWSVNEQNFPSESWIHVHNSPFLCLFFSGQNISWMAISPRVHSCGRKGGPNGSQYRLSLSWQHLYIGKKTVIPTQVELLESFLHTKFSASFLRWW